MPRSKKTPWTMDRSGLPADVPEDFAQLSEDGAAALLNIFTAISQFAETEEGAAIGKMKHDFPDWRCWGFYYFLGFSPSYDLARRWMAGDEAARTGPKPRDFERVLEVYRAMGDVHAVFFYDWYDQTLMPLLAQQEASRPEARRKRGSRGATSAGQAGGAGPSETKEGLINLKPGRVRELTVLQARNLIAEQVGAPYMRLFMLGQRNGISPVHHADEHASRRDAPDREIVEIMTSQRLLRAYRLAEHAARGHFPCLDPLDEDPGRPIFHAATMRANALRAIEAFGERAELFWQQFQDLPGLLFEEEADPPG